MPRIFVYDGREFQDPDPGMTVQDVQNAYAEFMPEVRNAKVNHQTKAGNEYYTFEARVGTKGSR